VPSGTVTVREIGTNLPAAIDRAAGRVERLVARRVERACESKPGGVRIKGFSGQAANGSDEWQRK